MSTILENDIEFSRQLPKYTVVTASAGSGKTTALTQRFVQLLLSNKIPHSKLRNILAITFTNNAAMEMKQRVLELLKKAYLNEPKTIEQLRPLLSLEETALRDAAGELVDEILDDYSDFQVQTIDSFLIRVFKASALEFGFSPDFEIVLSSDALLVEAFQLFARDLAQGSASAGLFNELINLLNESRGSDERYLWNPYDDLARKVKELYKRIILSPKSLVIKDVTQEIRTTGEELIDRILDLEKLVTQSGLTKKSLFEKYLAEARLRDIKRLLSLKLPVPPFTKSKGNADEYEQWVEATQPLCDEIQRLRSRLLLLEAHHHFRPYAQAHELFRNSIETVKRQNSQIDIGDVAKRLAQFLEQEVVPEIYYSLGDSIFHYLIDEFQDTNPIQWDNLYPLIDNSLAQGGSLFVVGDTKQSIYGFRGADWHIMKRLIEATVFPSAQKSPETLDHNFRSFERILQFNEAVFKTVIPTKVSEEAATASGLATYVQLPRDDYKGKGYVETIFLQKDKETDDRPEQATLLSTIDECRERGYRYRDIAILTPRNDSVVEVSGWLNERGIEFISHSSLDVRSRKITGELLALLRFLDSPIDDLSFAAFLLSDLFERLTRLDSGTATKEMLRDFIFRHRSLNRQTGALYTAFRQAHPEVWKKYFEHLFNVVGYLPIYDLTSEVYKTLRTFEVVPQEEATLVKLLEVVKNFEEGGENSLKDFLRYSEESSEDADWNIDIPSDVDAISIMTVHKAKGLGFPVVIVLLYDMRPRSDGLYVEETDEGIRLVHVTKTLADEVPEIKRLYGEKELRSKVDELNKLYVAFTRAKEEMYIISVKSDRAQEPSAYLPEAGFEPARKPTVAHGEEKPEQRVQLYHHNRRAPIRSTDFSNIGARETKRGEFIHLILSQIKFTDGDLARQIETIGTSFQEGLRETFDLAAIRQTLLEFFAGTTVNNFFTQRDGREVLNEQEFTARDGRLYRMDRVVLDRDVITVLDYKTGEEQEEYAEQVREYMSILNDVFPDRPVLGILAYVDRKILKTVE